MTRGRQTVGVSFVEVYSSKNVRVFQEIDMDDTQTIYDGNARPDHDTTNLRR